MVHAARLQAPVSLCMYILNVTALLFHSGVLFFSLAATIHSFPFVSFQKKIANTGVMMDFRVARIIAMEHKQTYQMPTFHLFFFSRLRFLIAVKEYGNSFGNWVNLSKYISHIPISYIFHASFDFLWKQWKQKYLLFEMLCIMWQLW